MFTSLTWWQALRRATRGNRTLACVCAGEHTDGLFKVDQQEISSD